MRDSLCNWAKSAARKDRRAHASRLALIVVTLSCTSYSDAAYKCKASDGTTSYQDKPCPAAQDQSEIAAPSTSDRRSPPPWTCTAIDTSNEEHAALKSAARAAIAASLKDPYSAHIRLLHARFKCAEGIRDLACGVVNAKNSYGAYVGDRLYVYTAFADGHSTIWTASDADPYDQASLKASAECAKHGK